MSLFGSGRRRLRAAEPEAQGRRGDRAVMEPVDASRGDPRSRTRPDDDADGRGDGRSDGRGDGRIGGRRADDVTIEEVRRELKASVARFGLAWEHSPIGMAMVTLDGDWLDANDALCRLLGRPREQLH